MNANAEPPMKKKLILFSVPAAVVLMASCGDPNSPGLEYFPDMYRSPAVEAYVDYGQDPYYFGDSVAVAERNTPSWRLPPAGTIAFAADQSKAAFNFPYPYANTPDDYERAGAELHSPIEMTEATVEKGKDIYAKFCVHCHGETGQGDGPVINNGGHPPPQAYSGPLKDLPEGKMFHTLTYGKGMMGSHASQLTKEERWLVIQYVKYLQNGGKMTRDAAPAAADTTAQKN
jgi:mono/diheme cytochrome c family protein